MIERTPTVFGGEARPSGGVGLTLLRGGKARRDLTVADICRLALPASVEPEARAWKLANFKHLQRRAKKVILSKLLHLPTLYGALELVWIDGRTGERTNLGLASLAVITTAGVNFLAADFAGGASDSNLFKFHGFGTGGTAEAIGDTALVTEVTTQYNPDSTRPTGSQSSSTNTYTTVATFTPDSGGTIAVTEHGIFSASSAGTLWDRSLFSVVNVNAATGDSLQSTYVATFSSGG